MIYAALIVGLVVGWLIGRYCRPDTPAAIQEAPTTTPPTTPARFKYDPDKHKMVLRCVIIGLLLTATVSSQAGNIAVMDPFTKGPKNLVPGAGIAFTGTTISATGVPAGFAPYTSAGGGRATNDALTTKEPADSTIIKESELSSSTTSTSTTTAANSAAVKAVADGLAAKADTAGLGGAAYLNVGTTAGTVAAGDDGRLVGALQPTGSGTGLTGVLKTADYKVINVLTAGVLGNGTDQGSQIQALIDGVAYNNTVLYFPTGTYGTSVELKGNTSKRVRFSGDGSTASVIKALAPMQSLFTQEGGTRHEAQAITGLQLNGNKMADVVLAVRNGSEFQLDDVSINAPVVGGIEFGLPRAYNSAWTYRQYHHVTSDGHIYRSLQDSNTNNPPASSPTYWLDTGAYDTATDSSTQLYNTRMNKVIIRSGYTTGTQPLWGIHNNYYANDNHISNCLIADFAVAGVLDEAVYTFYDTVYINGYPLTTSPIYGIWNMPRWDADPDDEAGIFVHNSYFDGVGPQAGGGAAIRLENNGNVIANNTFYRADAGITNNKGLLFKDGIQRTISTGNRFDYVVPYAFVSGTYGAQFNFFGNPGTADTIMDSKTFGTAANLNVGTSANNIVQLDADAKLPAIDGSQLINLPGGSSTPAGTVAGAIQVRNSDGTALTADDTVVVDATNHRIGVGNASPSHAVDVSGNVKTTYTVGSEKVTNGAFDTDLTSWTSISGWIYDSGHALHQTGVNPLEQTTAGIEAGKWYLVSFDVGGSTGGSFNCNVGGGSLVVIANGSYSFMSYATSTLLRFTPTTDFNGWIDNVSVKEITSGDVYAARALTVGTTTPTKPLQIETVGQAGVLVRGGAGYGATLEFQTHIIPTASGNLLSGLFFGAQHTPGSYANSLEISGAAGGAWTTGSSYPSALVFKTTAASSTSRTERMRIAPDGAVCIGNTTCTGSGNVQAKQFQDTPYAPAAGTTFTVDLANGMDQELTTTGNVTITLPTPVAGKSYTVTVKYGGAHTVTWAGGGTIKWSNGTAPTATSVSGKYDVYVFKADATGTYTMGADGGRNF